MLTGINKFWMQPRGKIGTEKVTTKHSEQLQAD